MPEIRILLNNKEKEWCDTHPEQITVNTLTEVVDIIYKKFTEIEPNEENVYITHLFPSTTFKNAETLYLTYNVDNNVTLKVRVYNSILKKEYQITKCISPIFLSGKRPKDVFIFMEHTILTMITNAYASVIHTLVNNK